MTEENGKRKPYKPRSVPIKMPLWWRDEMLAAFGDRSDTTVAEMLTTAAANSAEEWERSEVGKLRAGRDPTLAMIRAISVAFSVTSPVFVATTKAEAIDMQAVQRDHAQKRAKAAALQAIEGKEVTSMVTSLIEAQLGSTGIAEANAAAKASERKHGRRVLRDDRDRTKKHNRDVKL